MNIEYIRFRIDKEHQSYFVHAIGEACNIMAASSVCLNYEVAQCEEDTTLFVWRIEWASTDAHVNGFRKEKIFVPFYQLMQPFLNSILEMNHYHRIKHEN